MENLLEIILYLVCICAMAFAQAYVIHFGAILFCKENVNSKKLLKSFVCFIFVSAFTNWIYFSFPNLSFIKSIVSITALLLVTYFFYKPKLLRTILIASITTIIYFILDILVVLTVNIFFNNISSMVDILNDKKLYYLINILTNLVTILVFKLITVLFITRRQKEISENNNSTNSEKYKLFLYQGAIIIVTLIPSTILMFTNNYDYSLLFLIINTLQLIIVSIFSFFYIRKRIHFKDTELELENTKLHNKALSTINENIRGFKHDMGNMVQAINGYLAVGNIDGVKTYCKNLLQGFNDINLLSILSPKIINDPAIYGIVVSKMLYARDNNLTLSLDIGVDVSQINFPSFELSRIIGILLDNAIEASLESDEKKLKLEMYHDENRKRDIIIIGNSVKDPSKIDIIKMFEKNYSTKENPSGFGLYEVLKFLNKNNKGDIVPTIDYDNNFFTQTLTFDR